jgi:hypothetical protein
MSAMMSAMIVASMSAIKTHVCNDVCIELI